MDRLWAAGEPLTVREVHEQLAEHRKIAYTTVMTVLDRLAKKHVVRQEREGRAFRYTPVASREQMVAELMLDALGGVPSVDDRQAALVHFIGGVSPAEDASERVEAGATLVQGYTGFIYGGPLWPRRVLKGLS